jgi:glycosyltransferase involved in cell wall biosynthesis/2-polyprenyl-3-methyl-5-hydroxy-6-metoxy-1,4-benzoquinol methylase/GT2 family glycosyltransferase
MKRRKLKVAFLDTIGTSYTGDTLEKKGLGGSESAIIYMSRELTQLDFDVTVYNKCENEGIYDGVRYMDLSKVKNNEEEFDVLINSRTVLPYVPAQFREAIMEEFRLSPSVTYDITEYKPLVDRSKHKVLWLHDTFIMGENWFEDVLVDGHFDEVFTLSDYHTHYIARARHGNRERFMEVLKKKVFQTRNGIRSFYDWVDIDKKDPNLFVYNASTTKGLVPLLRQIWPLVKQELPDAKLTVIGGYYNLGFSQPDEIETLFRQLHDEYSGKYDISFTGIITQKEVADIMVKASFYIYPATFPETFGISAAEAMNYNVPLITTRFGALEEIAPESTSYLIDFPITKDMEHYHRTNPIADEGQVIRFVQLVKKAYLDSYSRQQKMYAANEFKPFLGWDTVALQWKHHLLRKLNLYMDRDEMERFRYINGRLGKLYDRRFVNPEEKFEDYTLEHKNEIAIISPTFNSWRFTPAHILSVAAQLYDNYTHYIIDDMSTDSTVEMARETIESLPERLRSRFKIISNTEKRYAIGNQVETIKNLPGNPIIVLLDGDDFFVNDPDVLNYVNRLHNMGAKFTYGSMHSLTDNLDLVAQPYPRHVLEERSYRKHLFNWGMPYTHLRTFRKDIFDKVDKSNFKDENGNYWSAGGDNSIFYPLMDQCEPNEIQAVQKILVRYNDLNPLNDYKINREEQTLNATKIRKGVASLGTPINKPLPTYRVINAENKDMSKIIEYVKNRNREIEENRDNIPASTSEFLDKARDRDPDAINKMRLWNRYSYLFPIRKDKNSLYHSDSHRYNEMISLVRSNISDYSYRSILDIGSGDAYLTRQLLSEGFSEATCVDSSMRGVEVAEQLFPYIEWVNKDIESYNVDKRYDLIILGDILNSIIDPKELVERLYNNNLKPGGMILFSVHFNQLKFANDETVTLIDETFLNSMFDYVYDTNFLTSDLIQYEWLLGYTIKDSYEVKEKTILIAIPTARNIETDTMKSIYDLIKPEGYRVDFQTFYGYNIDQVRNLMAHYTIENNYDYIFYLDSDIILPNNTLLKLLSDDKDIVSGMYIQRRTHAQIPEMYTWNDKGGMRNMKPDETTPRGLVEIAACGFGGVLIKKDVLEDVGYPYFVYKHSIDFKDTVSEDVDFCMKAVDKGYKIYLDTDIQYQHIARIDLMFN